jgi:23S rRNA (guanosine2251-2'-O)-methyltransferase
MSDIIFGKNPVLEAIKAKKDIEKIYVLATLRGELEITIRQWCKENNVPLAKIPEIKMNEICRTKVHQGVAAIISPITYQDIFEVLANEEAAGKTPLILILDGVTDIRNIGAVARSALFFGASGLVITGNFAGRINEEAVKSSAGALLKIPVSRYTSLLGLMASLQNKGVQLVGTTLNASVGINEADYSIPTAFILGSEDKGLHYKVTENTDINVKIQGASDFDSINVSVAAGICLYECQRQRKN